MTTTVTIMTMTVVLVNSLMAWVGCSGLTLTFNRILLNSLVSMPANRLDGIAGLARRKSASVCDDRSAARVPRRGWRVVPACYNRTVFPVLQQNRIPPSVLHNSICSNAICVAFLAAATPPAPPAAKLGIRAMQPTAGGTATLRPTV